MGVAAAVALAAQSALGALTHRFSFNGSGNDSVGGVNGVVNGAAIYTGGGSALSFNGTDTFVSVFSLLPVAGSTSIEIWGTFDSTGGAGERVFDFGSDQADKFYFTPKSTTLDTQLRLRTTEFPNNEQGPIVAGSLADNTAGLFTVVVDSSGGTLALYRDGNLLGSSPLTANVGDLRQATNYIGRSNNVSDPLLKGSINELRVHDTALTSYQMAINQTLGPDVASAATNNLTSTGAVNWAAATWSLGHPPAITEIATIANGAAVTINGGVGVNVMTKISNGSLTLSPGAALQASIDLAPGNANSATLNLNGGDLTAYKLFGDSGGASGSAAKTIAFNGGTLHTTGTFTLSGTALTTTVGASGATIDTAANTKVTWSPALTPTVATAPLTKLGAGTLALTGGGYAAPVTIRAGTLSVAGNVGVAGTPLLIGDAAATGGTTAALAFTGAGNVLSPINVGNSTSSGAYAINVDPNVNTVTIGAPVTLLRPLTITTGTPALGNGLVFTGGITSGGVGAKDLMFNNAGQVGVSTTGISDGGGGTLALVKNSTGVLSLNTTNTYTGGTTINGGGIIFNAAASIGGAGKNLTIFAGGFAVAGTGFNYANLSGTFFNRIANISVGTAALTQNSSESFNFSSAGLNLSTFLGSNNQVNYTGTLTPNNGSYRLGGGGGFLIFPNANSLTGANSLVVGGAGGGTVSLNAANNFTGGTTLIAGTLSVPLSTSLGTPSGTNGIAFNGGGLQIAGTTAFSSAQPLILLSAGGRIQVDNTFGATFTAGLSASAASLPFEKSGSALLMIQGTVNTGAAPFYIHAGGVNFNNGNNVTTGSGNSVGKSTGDNGTLSILGNAQYIVNGELNVGESGNARGALSLSGTALLKATTLFVGRSGSAQGSVNQFGATFTSNAAPGDWLLGGVSPADSATVGAYDINSGTLNTTGNLHIGGYGSGAMTVFGGSVTSGGVNPAVGRYSGFGVLSVNGGTFNQTSTTPGAMMVVGQEGTGVLNVSGSGTVNVAGDVLRLGHTPVGTGIVNLRSGGLITTRGVLQGGGASTFNFNGGTLRATADNPTFMQGLAAAYVQPGGAIFDTNGKNITIAQTLGAPTGSGVSAIALTNGGTGYTSTPVLKITGGGGSGATGVPILAAGFLSGIQITSAGVGYTSQPTVTIVGGGGLGAITGNVSLTPNTGGGLTKVGTGTLTLSAINTYTGDTTVNAGTLRPALFNAIPSGAGRGNLVVNGGASAAGTFDLNGLDVSINGLAGAAGAVQGQIVNGAPGALSTLTLGDANATASFAGQINGGVGSIALTKIGAGAQTLAGVNGYTGATTVNAGTLRVTGSIANSSGVLVAPGATFEAAATQTVKSLAVLSGQAKVTTGGAPVVLAVGDGVTADALFIADGKLDLNNNALVVDYGSGGAGTLLDVRSYIASGYNGGNWQGQGISSSTAAASGGSRAVGYARSSEVPLGPGGTFLGKPVDGSAVLARYTLSGDADLTGMVDFNDLVKLAQNYGTVDGSRLWITGDFTFDGNVDFNDLVKLAQNYGGTLPSAAIPGAPAEFATDMAAAFASVPEPGLLSVLGLGAFALTGRRRRNRRQSNETFAS